jgi:hypothetical protein
MTLQHQSENEQAEQTTIIRNTSDLLTFLADQANQRKDWFGRTQQKLTAIRLAHEIASNHANSMKPEEVVVYSLKLTQLIFDQIVMGKL